MECWHTSGWTADRDEDFVFYLLGKVADRQHEGETATEVGQWIAYALLHHDTPDTALAFGQEAAIYDSAISRLARRIAEAMRFLAETRTRRSCAEEPSPH